MAQQSITDFLPPKPALNNLQSFRVCGKQRRPCDYSKSSLRRKPDVQSERLASVQSELLLERGKSLGLERRNRELEERNHQLQQECLRIEQKATRLEQENFQLLQRSSKFGFSIPQLDSQSVESRDRERFDQRENHALRESVGRRTVSVTSTEKDPKRRAVHFSQQNETIDHEPRSQETYSAPEHPNSQSHGEKQCHEEGVSHQDFEPCPTRLASLEISSAKHRCTSGIENLVPCPDPIPGYPQFSQGDEDTQSECWNPDRPGTQTSVITNGLSSPNQSKCIDFEPSSDTPVVVSERVVRRRAARDAERDLRDLNWIKEEPRSPVNLDDYIPARIDILDMEMASKAIQTPRKRRRVHDTNETDLQTIPPICYDQEENSSVVHRNRALTPLDPNTRSPRRSKGSLRGALNLKAPEKTIAAMSTFAEDDSMLEKLGDEAEADNSNVPRKGAEISRRLQRTERLKSRLEDEAPKNTHPATPPVQRLAPPTRSIEPQSKYHPKPNKPPDINFCNASGHARHQHPAEDQVTTSSTKSAPARVSIAKPLHRHSPTTPTVNPQPHTPLRHRPLATLTKADFKPNPHSRLPTSFPTADTVRGAARTCLPGCTDPACCGRTFLHLAERGLLPESPPGRDRDKRAAAAGVVRQDGSVRAGAAGRDRSASEYDAPEARAARFAQRHARHRVGWPRAPSPPGYWRTEMPNTQERCGDREEADRRERVAVEERWRDAMRGGGRWMFRDEC